MRKVVSTEMSDSFVKVGLSIFSDLLNQDVYTHDWIFPLDVVNPRIALQIATLLVSDPTVPKNSQDESKEE